MESTAKLYVEQFCPLCKTGTIGFRFCDGENRVILMCDECDSVWESPDNICIDNALFLDPPQFCIPGTNCCLMQSRWATMEEINNQGWSTNIYTDSTREHP